MNESFKILPAVIVAILILFTYKVANVWTGFQAGFSPVAPATAQENPVAPVAESMTVDEPANRESEQVMISEGPDLPEASSSLLSAGFMTETEIEVLQSLANRRDALDKREEEIDLREKLLTAAESRVDDKISELKGLEEQIAGLLKMRDEKQEEQILSLVKMYETMKPKDAARIFENLETDVLLDVAGRMKEKSMAAILAAMKSDSAQDLTLMLVKRRDLPEFTEDALDMGAMDSNG